MNYTYYGDNPANAAEAFRQLQELQHGEVACDIETVSIDDPTPLGMGLSFNEQEAIYVPFDHPQFPWPVLRNPHIVKVFHNGHFDLRIIEDSFGVTVAPVVDTIVAANLLGLPASLHNLSSVLFGVDLVQTEELLGKRSKNQITMKDIGAELVAGKGAQDALYTLRAWRKLQPRLPAAAFELEMQVLPLLMQMERRGMKVDVERLLRHKGQLERDYNFYRSVARGYGFNPGSQKQVAAMLESRGWDVYYKRDTGNPIMNEEALKTYYSSDPIAQLVLLYRGVATLLRNFINPTLAQHIGRDGRIHGNITQTATSTGRFSRTKPNLQNIPPKLRDVFVPEPLHYYDARDFSQVELRVLAYFVWQWTGDYSMMKVYDDGGDLHTEVSGAFNIRRRVAKVVNFGGIAYRGGAYTIWEKTGLPLDEGEKLVQATMKRFPGLPQFYDLHDRWVEEHGYAETLLGRRRYSSDIYSEVPRIKTKALRELFNMPIQGSAGEIMKRFMVRMADEPQINTIHDELLFELSYGKALPLEGIADGLAPFKTPTTVKRGLDWLNMTEL